MVAGRNHRILTVVGVVLVAAGIVVGASGLRAVGDDASVASDYREAADALAPSSAAQSAAADPWADLLATNPDVIAWLRVGGTTIDLPVTMGTSADPDWYLSHDLWGRRSDTGNPYVDFRCEPSDTVVTVYGHRTNERSYMFHDLAGCFDQDEFDGLGTLTWETRDGETLAFEPLCSARLDASDQTWQRFGLMGTGELGAWLQGGCSKSVAKAVDWENECDHARRAIVLVTCSGRWLFGARSRTVTVFVQGGQ